MTITEAYEVLVKHTQFFEIYAVNLYVPRAMEGTVNEITEAYKVINPEFFNGRTNCTSCGGLLIVESNRARLDYLKNTPKKYNFND